MRRRRIIRIVCHGVTERLAMRAVERRRLDSLLRIYRPATLSRRHGAGIAEMRICCVSGYERLCLRGDRREDALLLETLAIRATSVIGSLETGAANLTRISVYSKHITSDPSTYLTSPAIPARDCGPLPWCRLTLILHVGWRRPTTWIGGIRSVHIVRWIHVGMLLMLRRR